MVSNVCRPLTPKTPEKLPRRCFGK
ncbi:unnamed protein product [Spodoptera littoralis]|uniref:Uncharacterized protein n=1 Tax=Spodoptera littoralis TaxID=7109 RepID=A0A9P0IFM0_SPOLI|nr:unnamed protein product [Spodoptera littoralis]CAH1646920.1 unnamed protein product [Spodoptera littoralis]